MALREFAIYPVTVGAGQVALSPVPGRFGTYEENLSAILHWGPSMVLSMTTQAKLDVSGAESFGDDLATLDIIWHHLPIEDFGVPDAAIDARWGAVSEQAAQILATGGKILTHCAAGCGRSGMVALRLMIEAGEDPNAALARLRLSRPCAVETDAQFAWASGA